MAVELDRYREFLDLVASEIDIPPSKYRAAEGRYVAVGNWLENGDYPGCFGQPRIYPQGSFRLGTVVRPIRNGIEASYDIDLVSEMPQPKLLTTPQEVKQMVGDRLRQHETYRRLLDPEGRRCWTLEYAEQDGVGFHLDVLPAVPDDHGPEGTAVAITDKSEAGYSWSASDPRGYGSWFDAKNASAFARVVAEQKRDIQRRASLHFASVDDVPDQLVRTPLQRSIQLLKRNRDLHFNRPEIVDHAPISIIITTLAAHLYGGESDMYSALVGIVGRLHGHAGLVENRAIHASLAALGLVQRLPDGRWYIANPVNPAENFADRWHEGDHARAQAFFSWLDAVQRDLLNFRADSDPGLLTENLSRVLGTAVVGKHVGVLLPSAHAAEPPPRIHITRPARPWRCG